MHAEIAIALPDGGINTTSSSGEEEMLYTKRRKCNDWPFAVAFLALCISVVVIGILGLHEMATLSFCDRIFPPDTPANSLSVSAPAQEVYNGCFKGFIRGNSDAADACTVFAFSKIMNLANELTTMATDYTSNLPMSVQSIMTRSSSSSSSSSSFSTLSSALSVEHVTPLHSHRKLAGVECLDYELAGQTPTPDCAAYAISLLLGSGGTSLYTNCVGLLMNSSSSTMGNSLSPCVGYALNLAQPGSGSVWQNCVATSTTTSALQTCVNNGLGSSGMSGNVTALFDSQCLSNAAPAVISTDKDPSTNTNLVPALRGCITFAATFLPLQSTSIGAEDVWDKCAGPLALYAPAAPISCARAAGLSVPIPAQALSCLSVVASGTSSGVSSDCAKYALSIFMGPSPADTLYDSCLGGLITANSSGVSQNAARACVEYALGTITPSVGTGVSTCFTANPTPSPALESCLMQQYKPILDPATLTSADQNCFSVLASATDWADPAEECMAFALSYSPALNPPGRTSRVASFYTSCLSPILERRISATFDCAQLAGIPVVDVVNPSVQPALACLDVVNLDPNAVFSPQCVNFGLSLVLGSDQANMLYQQCLSVAFNGTQAAGANACAHYGLSIVNPNATVVLDQCMASSTSPSTRITCLKSGLTPMIGSTNAGAVVDQCLSYLANNANPQTTISNCATYGLTIAFPGRSVGNLVTQCVQPMIDRSPNAVFGCAQLAGVPIPIPAGLQQASSECLSYVVSNSPLAPQKCMHFVLDKLLGPTQSAQAFSLCIDPALALVQHAPKPPNPVAVSTNCGIYALNQALGAMGSYSQCKNQTNSPAALEKCVMAQLKPTLGQAQTDKLDSMCLSYLVNNDPQTIPNCLLYAMQEMIATLPTVPPLPPTQTPMPSLMTQITNFHQSCIAPALAGDPTASIKCLKSGMLTILPPPTLVRLLLLGVQEIIPLSPQTQALLSPACLTQVFFTPEGGVSCLIDALIVAGANFARHQADSLSLALVGFSVEDKGEWKNYKSNINIHGDFKLSKSGHFTYPHADKYPYPTDIQLPASDNVHYFKTTKEDGRKKVMNLMSISGLHQQTDFDALAFSARDVSRVLNFAGLGLPICQDLLFRGAAPFDKYYNQLSDFVWSWRAELLRCMGWIVFFGVGLAVMWMAVVSVYAEQLIRFAICCSLCNLLVWAGVNFGIGNVPAAVLLLVYLVAKSLWYCWIRKSLAFAAAILRTALAALKAQPGPFLIGVLMFVLNAVFCIVFLGAVFYVYSRSNPFTPASFTDRLGEIFLVLSFFWTTEVLKNILACTISGSVAAWYYMHSLEQEKSKHLARQQSPRPEQQQPQQLQPQQQSSQPSLQHQQSQSLSQSRAKGESDREEREAEVGGKQVFPTVVSFARALTTSFGSICFGSLVVALLKLFIYLFKKGNSSKKPWVRAIIFLILKCLLSILEMFNMYAFVQVAVAGKTYLRSARDTFFLMKKHGLQAVVNDDIVDGVLGTGQCLGGLALAGLAGYISRGVYTMPWGLVAFILVVGFAFGYVIMSMATVVVEIATATLFVCFATNPRALAESEPDLYRKLLEAWEARHGKSLLFQPDPKSPSSIAMASPSSGGMNSNNLGYPKSPPLSPMSSPSSPASSNVQVQFQQLISQTPPPALTKYPQSGHTGRSKTRPVIIDIKARTLQWKSDASGAISLDTITSVQRGRVTESLKKNTKAEDETRCFCVFTDSRQLNFRADTPELAQVWVDGLTTLMSKKKGGAKKFPCNLM